MDATMRALAYVNHGRWIADCPHPMCGNAIALAHGQVEFWCQPPGGCGTTAPVAWPDEHAAITSALGERPVPATRNWSPPGHRQAHACGHPEGQTVLDLRAETAAYTKAHYALDTGTPTQLTGAEIAAMARVTGADAPRLLEGGA